MEEKIEELDKTPEVKQPKKKGSGGLVAIIIILLIAVLGLAGYICYDKGIIFSKKDKEETKEEKKEEVKQTVYSITDAKVESLVSNIIKGKAYAASPIEIFANDKKVETKDITSRFAYNIVFFNEYNQLKEKTSITLDEYTKSVQKYLGKNYKFNPEKILEDKEPFCASFKYNSSTKTFDKVETACGWTTSGYDYSRHMTVKAVDTNGTLVLDVKVLFAKDMVFYGDYNKTKVVKDYSKQEGEPVFTTEDFAKGSTYKFTFKLEDGNYVFVSSEPVSE